MAQRWIRPDFSVSGGTNPKVRLNSVGKQTGSLAGLRILLITDIHLRPGSDPERLFRCAEGLQPHLILYGGDFADTHNEAVRAIRFLKRMKAELGCYAVFGNNDHEAFEDAEEFRSILSENGIRLLCNEYVQLTFNGTDFLLGGTDDPITREVCAEKLFPTDGRYRICLSHRPLLHGAAVADLTLCGHTHGGQFNFLGLTPYSIGYECFRDTIRLSHIAGLKKQGTGYVFVSKGIGCSKIPLRIGVRSEIDLITLL